MAIIAVSNKKGGVGKTTTSVNLSGQAALKKKVLLIDADSQGNASRNFGIEDSTSFRDLMLGQEFEIVRNVRKNLDVIGNSEAGIGVDLKVINEYHRESILKKAIGKLDYDHIFIDCPPDVGIVTANAMVAADYLIIPMAAEPFALDGFDTMASTIRKVREGPNPDLVLLGILITLYDERLIISKKIRQDIIDNGWNVALFDTIIRHNTAVPNSQHRSQKKTVFEYDRKSHASQDYAKLGHEIMRKIKKLNSMK
ncbi:MAG: ParA family protein [Bacteroidota bacterium]